MKNVTTSRRAVMTAAAGFLATPALAQGSWPTRPVRVIVPFPPGGGTDTLARLLSQHLQARLGQPFVVENRGGGSATLGTETVARAAPDGYTLGVISSGPITILPQLMSLPYDPMGGFVHVALPAVTPLLLVMRSAGAPASLAEFLQRARDGRRQLTLCNDGVSSPSHLVGEMFSRAFNLDVVDVPYRGGGPALTDTVSGQCDLLFNSGTSAMPMVQQGLLRALGVTSTQRVARLPDVPTIAEQGAPGFEASAWSGVFAPAGAPAEIVALLNRETRDFSATPVQQQRLADAGSIPLDLPPEEFTAFLRQEMTAWGQVIRNANITLN